MLGPTLKESDLVGLWWGLRIGIFENPLQVILMYSQIGEHLNSDPVAYLVL